MNSKIDDVRQQLANLLDKIEDTELIADITRIGNEIDGIASDYNNCDTKYRELLGNYKDVIKHTSFIPKNEELLGQGLPKEQSLEELIKIAISKGD